MRGTAGPASRLGALGRCGVPVRATCPVRVALRPRSASARRWGGRLGGKRGKMASRVEGESAEEAARRLFADTACLAPMVRAGSLPMRLLSLEMGADTVYSPEIIAFKVPKLERRENAATGCVEYWRSGGGVEFSTHPDEAGRLVFQMGTPSAAVAVKAAEAIERDVDAFDLNMGCPKSFSVKGGMGAALLRKPEVAADVRGPRPPAPTVAHALPLARRSSARCAGTWRGPSPARCGASPTSAPPRS